MAEDKIVKFRNELIFNTKLSLSKWVGRNVGGRIYTEERLNQDVAKFVDEVFEYISLLNETELIDLTNWDNFDRFFEVFTNNFKTIDFLPENMRGVYGKTDEHSVFINPELPDWKRKLYMFHELAHCSIESTNEPPLINNNIKLKNGEKKIVPLKRWSTIFGYRLIEEALAQEIAETCFYKSINQPRPEKTDRQDMVIPKIEFSSNFDYYGLFQPLAINFGRVLRGVGTINDNSEERIMHDLCKKALKENLLNSVISEYRKYGIETHLPKIFYSLANVFSAKNHSFGVGYVTEKLWDINNNLLSDEVMKPTIEETENFYIQALKTTKALENYGDLFEKNE